MVDAKISVLLVKNQDGKRWRTRRFDRLRAAFAVFHSVVQLVIIMDFIMDLPDIVWPCRFDVRQGGDDFFVF